LPVGNDGLVKQANSLRLPVKIAPMLKLRVITSLIVLPTVVAIVLLASTPFFSAVIAALSLMALWEWTRLSGLQNRPSRVVCMGFYASFFALIGYFQNSLVWWSVICAGCLWWIGAIFWLRHFSFGVAPTRGNKTLKLIAGALIVIPAWTALTQLHLGSQQGPIWTLFALILIWMADTSAYFAGRRWGTVKLAPRISPGKTRAGAYGALIGAILIALIGGWLLNLRGVSLFFLAFLAVIITVFSIVGDLFESMIKRHCNVKDSGALFPGHGGVFDRLDSIFAALPVLALGKALLAL